MDARRLDNYVGASQRYSQRILVSVAAHTQIGICTTDKIKACVLGVTYKELAEATGEPLREVNFVLPAYCVAVLRTIPGYEDFNPASEVIHCENLEQDVMMFRDVSHSSWLRSPEPCAV